MKKILLITTGGTIASVASNDGLIPNNKVLDNFINSFLNEYQIEILDLFNLDSSNIQPEEWVKIACSIHDNMNFFDGIVVTHGTDTMAYTASILSYMLKNISIPVVLTGSQLPINHSLTDAMDNLRLALKMAESGTSGIFIAFNRKIILGTRAVKVRTTAFDAFESVNHPNVGTVDSKGLVIDEKAIYKAKGSFEFNPLVSDDVFLVKLIPGFNPKIFEMLKDMKYKGIIIEAFGAGGLHFVRRNLVAEIKMILDSGIPVVVCSQCLYEKSNFNIYQTGREVLKVGAIEASDMTTEAAVTKLMWAIGCGMNIEEIRNLFRTNIAGEIAIE